MTRFYMDENVEAAITRELRLRGVDALTVQEDGRAASPDPHVLDRATQLDRVLFSQDTDLLAEAAKRQKSGVFFTGVIYAHKANVALGVCIEYLEVIAIASEPEEYHNRVVYIPFR